MSKRLDPAVYRGINRAMTPEFGRWAQKTYGMGGKKLLAKVASAEGGGTAKRPNVSSAGARGPFQFIPSTRSAYIDQYGVDAWKTNTSAAKAAMIHLKGTGVAGYNPGMGSYEGLVLGQDVDTSPLRTGGKKSGGRLRAGRPGRPGSVKRTVTKTPGVDNSDLRKQLKLSYLQDRDDPDALLELASGLKGAGDVAPVRRVRVKRTPGVPGRAPTRGGKGSVGLKIRPDKNKGAKQVVEFATRGVYTSGERTPAQNAAVGGAAGSDHLTTNTRASAADAKYGSGKLIAKRLGLKGWKKGNYDRHTVTIDGRKYSVQILEDVEGHYDHTHVGAQRV